MSILDALTLLLALLAAISADKPVLVVAFTVLAAAVTAAKEMAVYGGCNSIDGEADMKSTN